MKKAWIYCGVPGSGKSTLVKRRHPDAEVCSTDKFFLDENDRYQFDVTKLSEAHGWCLRNFTHHVSKGIERDVVVDNTNTSIAEIAPYAALAQAFGYELQIVTVECDPDFAARRNVHGVPADRVAAMAQVLAERSLPPWWPHEIVKVQLAARGCGYCSPCTFYMSGALCSSGYQVQVSP